MFFHHYDALGNCILISDGAGVLREQYDYQAFGTPYFYNPAGTNIFSSPWGNRFLFKGREWLSDLKLYDNRHRLYSPSVGRFLQPDPTHFEGGDYNLYRYCHNDPINRTDPTGLVDLSLNGPEPKGNTEWERSYNPSDRFTLVVHSDGKGFIQNGEYISAAKVADKMMANGYTAGKPVEAIACESGRDGKESPAQKLANVLAKRTGVETEVRAPDGKCASAETRGAPPSVRTNEKTGEPGQFKSLIGKPPPVPGPDEKKKNK